MLVSYRKSLAVERANKEASSLKLRSEMLFMDKQLKAEQVIVIGDTFMYLCWKSPILIGQKIAYGKLPSIWIAWSSWWDIIAENCQIWPRQGKEETCRCTGIFLHNVVQLLHPQIIKWHPLQLQCIVKWIFSIAIAIHAVFLSYPYESTVSKVVGLHLWMCRFVDSHGISSSSY